jgi:hypothetical protein
MAMVFNPNTGEYEFQADVISDINKSPTMDRVNAGQQAKAPYRPVPINQKDLDPAFREHGKPRVVPTSREFGADAYKTTTVSPTTGESQIERGVEIDTDEQDFDYIEAMKNTVVNSDGTGTNVETGTKVTLDRPVSDSGNGDIAQTEDPDGETRNFLRSIGQGEDFNYDNVEEDDGWKNALLQFGTTALGAYVAKKHGANDRQVNTMLLKATQQGGAEMKRVRERYGRQENIDILEAKGYQQEDIKQWLDTNKSGDLTKNLKNRPFSEKRDIKTAYYTKGAKMPDGSTVKKDGNYDIHYTYDLNGKPEVAHTEYMGENINVMTTRMTEANKKAAALEESGVDNANAFDSANDIEKLISDFGEGGYSGVFDSAGGAIQEYTGLGVDTKGKNDADGKYIPGSRSKSAVQSEVGRIKKAQIGTLKEYFGPQISDADIEMMLGYDNIDLWKDEKLAIEGLRQVQRRYTDILERNGVQVNKGAPAVGTIVDGYSYIGGNPNSQSSWKAVN